MRQLVREAVREELGTFERNSITAFFRTVGEASTLRFWMQLGVIVVLGLVVFAALVALPPDLTALGVAIIAFQLMRSAVRRLGWMNKLATAREVLGR